MCTSVSFQKDFSNQKLYTSVCRWSCSSVCRRWSSWWIRTTCSFAIAAIFLRIICFTCLPSNFCCIFSSSTIWQCGFWCINSIRRGRSNGTRFAGIYGRGCVFWWRWHPDSSHHHKLRCLCVVVWWAWSSCMQTIFLS